MEELISQKRIEYLSGRHGYTKCSIVVEVVREKCFEIFIRSSKRLMVRCLILNCTYFAPLYSSTSIETIWTRVTYMSSLSR